MTAFLPVASGIKIIRALQRAGFYIHHQSGSHAIMKHPDKPKLRVSVPAHTKDLRPGTIKDILRTSELTSEELRELL